jgi:hypothetical protein
MAQEAECMKIELGAKAQDQNLQGAARQRAIKSEIRICEAENRALENEIRMIGLEISRLTRFAPAPVAPARKTARPKKKKTSVKAK